MILPGGRALSLAPREANTVQQLNLALVQNATLAFVEELSLLSLLVHPIPELTTLLRDIAVAIFQLELPQSIQLAVPTDQSLPTPIRSRLR